MVCVATESYSLVNNKLKKVNKKKRKEAGGGSERGGGVIHPEWNIHLFFYFFSVAVSMSDPPPLHNN